MSTKTTFKRIALVAVAALGLGVLSVAPSSAAAGTITLTVANGTAGQFGAKSDSTTAATITVQSLLTAGASDSITVTFIATGTNPATSVVAPRLWFMDTTTASTGPVTITNPVGAGSTPTVYSVLDSVTATTSYVVKGATAGSPQIVSAKFALQLDSLTSTTRAAGTYNYLAIVKGYTAGVGNDALTTTSALTITVAAVASESKVASVATSTLTDPSVATADATVSTTRAAAATLTATLLNAASGAASESVTATITGPGTIGDGTVNGKSVVLKYTGALTLNVYSDGTAGTATINVSSTSVAFSPKTVTFYATSPKTITAAVYNPVLNVGANAQAVAATAVDSLGNNWAGQLYIVASSATDALVGGSATAPVACSYSSTYKTHFCPITTLTVGTAKFKVVDESLDLDGTYAAADSAATSNEVSVTASAGVPTTVKLAFDKASYQPFEKAIITVTPLDSAGKTMGSKTVSSIFATGGISSNIAFGSQSDTLTAVSLTTSADSSSTAPRTAGSYTYVVYMPAQGTVTISATGGTGLAAAGQVAVTASANVVNSSVDAATDAANEATDAANAATDAALAAADAADAATAAAQDASDAVAALSATVATLVASLKAQITSLTNLVIKIQKKVKA